MRGNPNHDERGRFCSANKNIVPRLSEDKGETDEIGRLERKFSRNGLRDTEANGWSIKERRGVYEVSKDGEVAFSYQNGEIKTFNKKYEREAQSFLKSRKISKKRAEKLLNARYKNGVLSATEEEMDFIMDNATIESLPPELYNAEKSSFIESRRDYYMENLDLIQEKYDIPTYRSNGEDEYGYDTYHMYEFIDDDSARAHDAAKWEAEEEWEEAESMTISEFDYEYSSVTVANSVII